MCLLLLEDGVFGLDSLLQELLGRNVGHFVAVQLLSLLLLPECVQMEHKFADHFVSIGVEAPAFGVKIHNSNYNYILFFKDANSYQTVNRDKRLREWQPLRSKNLKL